MKKYYLKNLDCARCAADIENELKKLSQVNYVSVNFATSTMHISTVNMDLVNEQIKQIDPKIEIEEVSDTNKEHSEQKTEIVLIISSIILFITGIIFKNRLHNILNGTGEYIIFLTAYILSGWNVLYNAFRNIFRGKIFDENFLMTIATLGAIIIHELPEAVGVMLFYKIGEFFQELSLARSRNSIKALLEIKPDYANLRIDGGTKKVSPEDVVPGDIIIVKPGEKIPLDGEIIDGNSQVDTSALTGEVVPRIVRPGDTILAGMVNKTGILTVKVTRPLSESSITRILKLVENASSRKAETEKFITRFAKYYTPFVVFTAISIAIFPPIFLKGATFTDWLYRALILLVISCPCALVISIPLGYFGGIGGASRRGILVKGSNFLDALALVNTVVFDKTGTLTKGVFNVTQIVPQNGFTKEEILQYAAEAESQSNHPIACSILEAYGKNIDSSIIKDYKEITGNGIVAKIGEKTVLLGNDRLLHRENIEHKICIVEGTVIHIVIDKIYAGYIIIADELKEDSKQAMKDLNSLGIENIIMLTGDNEYAAKDIAQKLGITTYYAELLPEAKVEMIEKIKDSANEGKVAFVGDGINDAPVIARADVGIAMGGLGSDAAIETADVVVMTDAPSKVAEGIKIGRKTRTIVWENIGFALTVKAIFILLGIGGLATMWEAVFADVGVALLSIFNATRILFVTKKY